MKTYKSSDLTNKRAEVFREAEENGVIIQQCRTNGDITGEFIIYPIDNGSRVIVDDVLVLSER